ncbi:MAG: hypothetical protein V4676_10895 [Bacteroidota bacterium]
MKTTSLYLFVFIIYLTGCTKNIETNYKPQLTSCVITSDGFTAYKIPAGNHFSEGNNYKPVQVEIMKFTAWFDSSAIYQTSSSQNQYDINKLWGFADNDEDHHQYSARFGWRWSDGALRLFAYVYNEGRVTWQELTVIEIGAKIKCAIAVTATNYVFIVDEKETLMPRLANTTLAMGYQLYPYFGGDEVAPHEINVFVRAEP